MKILYLTKYTNKAASSRMRSFQYFPFLKQQGMNITVSPFFNESYLNDFYAGKKNVAEVIKSYFRRFFVLFTVFRYDKIVVEKEIFPFMPAFAERLLHFIGAKYIVDYDDAIFHNYDQSSSSLIRRFLGGKISKVMKYSVVVTAGNTYLSEYAKRSGAKKVEIIPTVIDLERYSLKKEIKKENDQFVIGWIGTKTTSEKHLLPCRDWMKKLQSEDPQIQFNIIGVTDDINLGANVKYIPWSKENEVQEILKIDVCIMPLQDSLWEKGKCAYKLIQYAACGIPGVASDVGMNKEVCINGKTGFTASSQEQWIENLKKLKADSLLRNSLGKNARNLVEEKYCIQVTAEKLCRILKNI